MNLLYSFGMRLGRPGIGMTAWNQVNCLIKSGVNVTTITGSLEKPLPGLKNRVESLKYLGIKIPISLIGNDKAFQIHDHKAAKYLSAHADEIDVFHCWPSGSEETLRVAKAHGIPTFLERPSSFTLNVLQIMNEACKNEGIQLNRKHYAAFDEKKIQLEQAEFDLADFLLCPSPYALKTHVDGGIDPKKLLLHQYGYDPSIFFPGNFIPMSDGFIRGLFVGEGNPMKGIQYALEAWFQSGLYKNGKFTICGQILPEFRDKLSKWLEHPSIELIGFTNNVEEYMRTSDFLILPSQSEGSSLVTYEARACGCCILVSESSGAYCEHEVTGLIHKTGSVEVIVEHMRKFIEHPEQILAIRKRSLEDIHRWTWEASVKELISYYSKYNRLSEVRS